MLELENYKVIYNDKIINYKDININEGEFIGLSGDSGCGKTSLLNSLFGYNFQGQVSYTKGLLLNQKINKLDNKTKFKLISYCPQFCQDALNPKIDIKSHIDLTLKSNSITLKENDIQSYFNDLGLDASLINKLPYMLSGGQKQRLVLLLSIIKNPKLLILDEPSSALDSLTLKIIVDFLLKIREGKTIIMVSHNKSFLYKLSDRVIVL